MNLKVTLAIAIAVLLALYASWKGGYESALEDVRYGNVKVHPVMN